MNISEIKDLMSQFDKSSLKEFSYSNGQDSLNLSKNDHPAPSQFLPVEPTQVINQQPAVPVTPASVAAPPVENQESTVTEESVVSEIPAEGEVVESPLVGVVYLSPTPDKPAFVQVGDSVKKGQTLVIIEAMKVMNEVPAPRDGIVTEILVSNEEVADFGKGLVRIK